jgi:hypothetical protein
MTRSPRAFTAVDGDVGSTEPATVMGADHFARAGPDSATGESRMANITVAIHRDAGEVSMHRA